MFVKLLALNLETAVQDDKVMQDFELESLLMGGDHSQKVKAPTIRSDSGSKDCVNLSSSTAVSRLKALKILHWYSILFLVLFCGIYFDLNAAHHKTKEPAPIYIRKGGELFVPENSPLRERLTVTPVEEVDSPHIVILPAVVEADPTRIVNILPPLTGRLAELKVNLGDIVEANQVLAIIHSGDLDQAYSDVDKARDALDLAKKVLERVKNVHTIGANAVKEIEQATSNYTQVQAETKRAEDRLKSLLGTSADNDTGMLSLNAPISGTVTALNYGIGSYITDPTAALMTISNLEDVWVTAYVPENLIKSMAKGQSVDIALSAYPKETMQGTIHYLSPLLEPDSHRNKARILFSNPNNKLKPNMYANVSVSIPEEKQIIVPLSALLMNNDTVTVFVEIAPWTFVRKVVELGREDGDKVRILSGLAAGDHVVVRGGVLLND